MRLLSLAIRVAGPALAPALVTVGLAALLWRATPLDFVPLWNDEVVYWNEVAAFMRAGFEGGYITVTEAPARAPFSHFGPHGAAYAVFYGALGRVMGWNAASPFLVHLVVVTLGAAAWFWVRRRQPGRLGEALTLATFWPLLLYLPTGMTEPLHFSIALLFVALLDSPQPTRRNLVARAVLFVAALLLRPTWALILPALVRRRLTTRARWIAVTAAMAVLAVAAFVFQSWTSAPYPQTAWRQSAVLSPAAMGFILGRVWDGVRILLTPHEQWFITLYRAELVIGLVALCVLWYRARGAARERVELAALMLLPVLASQLALADIESGRELRVVAAHGLAALLLVATVGRWTAAVSAAVGVALLPTLFTTYTTLHDGRFTRAKEARDFGDAVREVLTFDAAATSPWENTLLVHADALSPGVIGTPPGIGVSYVLDWDDLPSPPRSRYVLLRPRDETAFRLMGMQPVARVREGTIYRRAGDAVARSAEPTPP
jgi:hypothetical protein